LKRLTLEQRICQFWVQYENVSVVECEFHVVFCCNFYTLMSSTNEETIYKPLYRLKNY